MSVELSPSNAAGSSAGPHLSQAELAALVAKLTQNVEGVVLGKSDVVRLCLVALLAGEHVLLEDVPGVGKTLVGKALAKSLSGEFCRIQFTPDLLPSDILGTSVFNMKTSEFSYTPGPIFANVVLADEINRAPPRTQSALLEAMSEGQVSIDGKPNDLPRPFLVIATQNPFEYEGTYVLPESQLDRFLLRISMGYPDRDAERKILEAHREGEPVNELSSVVTSQQVVLLQQHVRRVKVDTSMSEYLLSIVHATRESPHLHVGVSTRAMLSLYRASQSHALLDQRDYVVPDDIKSLAVSALSHRVVAKGYAQGTQRTAVEAVVRSIVDDVPVPV